MRPGRAASHLPALSPFSAFSAAFTFYHSSSRLASRVLLFSRREPGPTATRPLKARRARCRRVLIAAAAITISLHRRRVHVPAALSLAQNAR
jgi:hypothetical protein